MPGNETTRYYDFDLDEEGYTYQLSAWSFGGSLETLVNQLGLGWWPALPALTNVAVFIDLENPIGIEEHEPQSSNCIRSLSNSTGDTMLRYDIGPDGCATLPYTGGDGPAVWVPGNAEITLHNVSGGTIAVTVTGGASFGCSGIFPVPNGGDHLCGCEPGVDCPLTFSW